MKRYLLAGALVIASSPLALAADTEPAPVYDWTGFYFGLNARAAWNNSDVDTNIDPAGLPGGVAAAIKDEIEGDQTVFTGGAQMGYNWQIDSVVLGLEADFNFVDFDESNDNSFPAIPADTSLSLEANWFGTVRARLGFAADNFLIYGTGGLAYGHAEVDGDINVGANSWHGDQSETNLGWTIGGGAQYAINQNWIIGAEYLYVDLGESDFDFDSTLAGNNSDASADFAFSVVRARIDYKF